VPEGADIAEASATGQFRTVLLAGSAIAHLWNSPLRQTAVGLVPLVVSDEGVGLNDPCIVGQMCLGMRIRVVQTSFF
jgi:hypothetical protein